MSRRILQEQVAFFRTKLERLIDLIHDWAELFFNQRCHCVRFSFRFRHKLPVSFIQFVFQANFVFQFLLFVRDVFAKRVKGEEQDNTNCCERTQNLKLVRQPSDAKTIFHRTKQKGQ